MSKHANRRELLTAMALGAGSLTFGDPAKLRLGGNRALAQAAMTGPPRRLIMCTMPNGVRERRPADGPPWESCWSTRSTETDFKLGSMTSPLERHKDALVILDGINLAPIIDGDRHVFGYWQLWTSRSTKNIKKPMWPSVDQYLASKIGQLTPRWPSLFLGVHSHLGDQNATFGLDGRAIEPIRSPYTAYSQLFSTLMTGTTSGPDPALVRKLALRKSVLDSAARDLTEFKKTLPLEDRTRAEVQLDAIRTLEARLATGTSTANVAACGKPKQTAGVDLENGSSLPAVLEMQLGVMTAALACDLTRIVNLHLGGQLKPQSYAPVNMTTDIHDLSHNHQDQLCLAKNLWFQYVAKFVDSLKAIPEPGPNGTMGTMLDNTLIVVGSEISTGHSPGRIPYLTLGGKNLGVVGGRHVVWEGWPKVNTQMSDGYYNLGKMTNGKLMASMLNTMGVMDRYFGDVHPEFGDGPLPGFLS